MWSRLWHLPIALKLSILGLLSAVVTLVITQYELPPSTPLTISFSPNLVEFRSTALHVPAMTQSVTVTNRAETSLTLGPVTIAGPAQEDFFISENSCQEKTLPAGGDCRISVIFTPSVDGPRVAEVSFHDAARRESAQLSLQGSTGPPPKTELGQMLLTPNPFDFGAREIGAGITASLTVTNSGSAPLRVVEIVISGAHRQDFSDGESDCRQKQLAQRMSCAIPITFTPSGAGARTATLTVVEENGSKERVALSGSGMEAIAP